MKKSAKETLEQIQQEALFAAENVGNILASRPTEINWDDLDWAFFTIDQLVKLKENFYNECPEFVEYLEHSLE